MRFDCLLSRVNFVMLKITPASFFYRANLDTLIIILKEEMAFYHVRRGK